MTSYPALVLAVLLLGACSGESSNPPVSSKSSAPTGTTTSPAGTPPSQDRAAGAALAQQHRPDFDGDGYGDLAVGAPDDPVSIGDAVGSVSVVYGGAHGPTKRKQRWHRDLPGVEGVASPMIIDVDEDGMQSECCQGQFGEVVATGDFNGDGYTDLVASAHENEAAGEVPAQPASVNVLYGSAAGLTTAGNQLWSLASPGVAGEPGAGDFRNIVAGDFNGDRRDDLVFTSFTSDYDDEEGKDVGIVHVHLLPGTSRGLTATGSHSLSGYSAGVAANGNFTDAMAVGDFNGDLAEDLAVTAYEESREGSVTIFFGGPDGISADRDEKWTARSPGVREQRGQDENFGHALAAGDFNGDSHDELAVAVRDDDDQAVLVLHGTRSGLSTSAGVGEFRATSSGMPASVAGYHEFGNVLSAADVNGDGKDDLAVVDSQAQLPDETLCEFQGEPTSQGTAVLFLLRGSARGLVSAGAQALGLANIKIRNVPRRSGLCLNRFGEELTFGDHNGDGYTDLDVTYSAVPLDEGTSAGAARGIAILPGSAKGLEYRSAILWGDYHCCTSGGSLPRRERSTFGREN